MENIGDPGISIAFICLSKANVALGNIEAEKKYDLRLVGFGRQEAGEGKFLDILASFDLMYEIPDPSFKLTCEFLARYQRLGDGGLPWEKFTSAMALAHLIPYLREFVSNTTSRLMVPVLMLNPVNAYNMFDEYMSRIQPNKQVTAEADAEK